MLVSDILVFYIFCIPTMLLNWALNALCLINNESDNIPFFFVVDRNSLIHPHFFFILCIPEFDLWCRMVAQTMFASSKCNAWSAFRVLFRFYELKDDIFF